MFRKNKHVYTCSDVIHQMNLRKRNSRITLGVWAVTMLGSLIYGWHIDKQMNDTLETEDPFDTIPKD